MLLAIGNIASASLISGVSVGFVIGTIASAPVIATLALVAVIGFITYQIADKLYDTVMEEIYE